MNDAIRILHDRAAELRRQADGMIAAAEVLAQALRGEFPLVTSATPPPAQSIAPRPAMPDGYIGTAEAASILGCTPTWARVVLRRGVVKGYRTSPCGHSRGTWLFERASVEAVKDTWSDLMVAARPRVNTEDDPVNAAFSPMNVPVDPVNVETPAEPSPPPDPAKKRRAVTRQKPENFRDEAEPFPAGPVLDVVGVAVRWNLGVRHVRQIISEGWARSDGDRVLVEDVEAFEQASGPGGLRQWKRDNRPSGYGTPVAKGA